MSWSPEQYVKFEAERNRPIRDLLAQISVEAPRAVADLGCGPGNSTELLRARFPQAAVVGMDSSPEMIEAARRRLPDVRFEVADVAAWNNPGPFDVILANAVLQWAPDHAALLPKLVEKLAPGGCLAVQVPDNLDEPAHRLMREVAADGPWSARLAGVAAGLPPRHPAEWYYETLSRLASTVDVWRTTYYHALPGGASAVVEWFKATGLRPFLAPLTEPERAAFLTRYEAALEPAYPALPDARVLLPFPRLFFTLRTSS